MIRLDLANCAADRVGTTHGFELGRELDAYAPRLGAIVDGLLARADDDAAMLGWIALADDAAVADAAVALRDDLDPSIRDVVVLGIGGSSLGAITLERALARRDARRLHVVDNVDGDVIAELLDRLDPRTTVVNVISKSGTTAETMAAFLAFSAFLETALGEAEAARRILVTTDPATGALRPLAARRGYRTFSVPPSVGGRFSVLSAVGLVPVALAGLDVHALLRGAAWANETVRSPIDRNPILQAALVQYLALRRGKAISVLMPYSSRLAGLGPWFVQLWAESLGKALDRRGSRVHAGSTPLAALGATDQHSQVQLFNEGPNDKLIAFVRVERSERDLRIPEVGEGLEALAYLGGRRFSDLLNAEQAATAHALMRFERPNYTLSIERVDEEHLGALLQLLMWQTAIVGDLLGIDAFDQPGVELGKRFTYALMGRDGFEALRAELAEAGVGLEGERDEG
jgi:glucose-6-phosphate isomerase